MTDIERLRQRRIALLVTKSKIDALGIDARNAYIALGPAGRGGVGRIERSLANIQADITDAITELAEDEADMQDAEIRGEGKSVTEKLIAKRDYLNRRIAQRLEKENGLAFDEAKTVR